MVFLFSPLQIKKYSHLEDLLHISFCLVEDFFESLDIIFVFEDNWSLSPECTFEISTLLMHGMFVYISWIYGRHVCLSFFGRL